MRKITRQIMTAFLEKRRLKISNSESTGTHVTLFDNTIVIRGDSEDIHINSRGFATKVTQERFNGLLKLMGARSRILHNQGIRFWSNGYEFIHNSWIRIS